ncbi:hypothetical protein [uncultured Cellulomonas sp.]|uniref:hypothetical protein n=1 Tax=uncultured Cellulomonas sp. TaxID=189682 RepID=UPI0028EBE658|nr:hypothetical protein [uncultured Cellulomonas sp.]
MTTGPRRRGDVSSSVGSILIILGAGVGFFMFVASWIANLSAALLGVGAIFFVGRAGHKG